MQYLSRSETEPNLSERRMFARERTGREISIWLSPQESIMATMIDQGEGGIGVIIESVEAPETDSHILVEFEGTRRLATVTSVRIFEDHQQIRLGLSWGL